MINFEPKYVHCFWDNELEGKKGIVSDTIGGIKDIVENITDDRYEKWFGEICKNPNNSQISYPFGFINDSGSSECFQFCYYDPNFECKIAYEEGKTIQYFSKVTDKWKDCETRPLWNGDPTEYRIKPEEKKEDKYVPFENIQELIEAWEKKCPANKDRPNGTMPLIWIKEKKNEDTISLIVDFGSYGVSTAYNVITFTDLFEKYTFTDDSVCGKRK